MDKTMLIKVIQFVLRKSFNHETKFFLKENLKAIATIIPILRGKEDKETPSSDHKDN